MGDDLIDAYVDELRAALRWRADVDDIAAEAEDHLREATDRLVAEGRSPDDAEAAAIAEFGHPGLVARAHAAGAGDRLAVPTSATRTAGLAALGAAVLWVAVPILWWTGDVVEASTGEWTGTAQLLGAVGALCLLVAMTLTTLAAVGLVARHGGLGPAGVAAVVLLALGTVMSFVGWFLAGWMVLGGAGAALLALAARGRGLAPRWPLALFGSGLLVGLAGFAIGGLLGVGSPDEWGDHPVAEAIGLGLATGIIAVGLVGLGRWLATEEPAPQQALAAR